MFGKRVCDTNHGGPFLFRCSFAGRVPTDSCGGFMSILGTRVIRTEDPRLLTVGGVYVDDLREPELAGAVRATFVRATVAHALITGIDKSEALAQPGVVAVLTAADMTDLPAAEPP